MPEWKSKEEYEEWKKKQLSQVERDNAAQTASEGPKVLPTQEEKLVITKDKVKVDRIKAMLVTIIVLLLIVIGAGGYYMLSKSKEQAAREQPTKEQRAVDIYKEQAASEQAAREQAAKEQAPKEQAARDKGISEKQVSGKVIILCSLKHHESDNYSWDKSFKLDYDNNTVDGNPASFSDTEVAWAEAHSNSEDRYFLNRQSGYIRGGVYPFTFGVAWAGHCVPAPERKF